MIVVVCSAFIVKGDSVLLVHEKKMDKYGLPGGKLEESESLRACVARECMEEIGAQIGIDGLIMMTEKPKTRESNTVIRFIYKAHIISELDDAELEYQYFNKNEIDSLIKDGLIRGKDVASLMKYFYDNEITIIVEPIIYM